MFQFLNILYIIVVIILAIILNLDYFNPRRFGSFQKPGLNIDMVFCLRNMTDASINHNRVSGEQQTHRVSIRSRWRRQVISIRVCIPGRDLGDLAGSIEQLVEQSPSQQKLVGSNLTRSPVCENIKSKSAVIYYRVCIYKIRTMYKGFHYNACRSAIKYFYMKQ